MIRLADTLPKCRAPSAELVKILCTYDAYKDTALFWVQDGTSAIISMLDGNMVIYNASADIEELREFIGVISPVSVFSDAKTLSLLFGEDFERVCVFCRTADGIPADSDNLSSREVYELLNVDGLELPPYEYFAVDFCHRINHGFADCFAQRDTCAAVMLKTDGFCLLNGIASHKKGAGATALSALLYKSKGKTALCVCREENTGFYLKCGFEYVYDCGYWRKKT